MSDNEMNRTALYSSENGEEIIVIRFPYPEDFEAYKNVNLIYKRKYNYETKYWIAPLKFETLESLINWGFALDTNLLFIRENLKVELSKLINSEIKGLNGQLFQYQKEGVAFIERCKGRALISDETGLGKTVQTLAWLQKHPENRPAVIVVPSCQKLNWKNEVERWMSNPLVELMPLAPGSWKLTGEILITSYDELIVCVNKIKPLNINVLVLDEIHYISDKTANQTKAVKKLSKDVPHIICLTGISIVARPNESYTAIKLIQPDLFPSPADFIRRYGNMKPHYFGWDSYGVSQDKSKYAFNRSKEKLTDFMSWLQEQVDKGLIEIKEFNQIGDPIETEWTNKYIADSYRRKELRSRDQLAKEGIHVPTGDESKASILNINTPFHIDRVGLLFTRVFSELSGISDGMDAVISRLLSQGMIDGEGPVAVARKIEAAINGTGLGDLGVTNEFLADTIISAKRRAKMIAHTEMMRAYHKSTIQDYKNSARLGIEIKAEWKTAGDNRVCDLCKALDGKLFTLDEIEDMIPLHPECRCIALPYIEEHQKYFSKPKEQEDWLGLREGIDTRNSHISELYSILTGTIMIRRLKKDVVKFLPPKMYSLVPLELDNFEDYNQAEKEFIDLIKNNRESDFENIACNTKTLTAIEPLWQLVIKIKLRQSIDWIKNFLEVGNKLIVLTNRQFVVDALIDSFQNISVRLDDLVFGLDQQKVKNDFQVNPNFKLFVGDLLQADLENIYTLASNIAFLEFPWIPGGRVQEENLAKMTSQKDFANIYYLYLTSTIEERIAKSIFSKPMVVYTISDCLKPDYDLIINELIKEYKNADK